MEQTINIHLGLNSAVSFVQIHQDTKKLIGVNMMCFCVLLLVRLCVCVFSPLSLR